MFADLPCARPACSGHTEHPQEAGNLVGEADVCRDSDGGVTNIIGQRFVRLLSVFGKTKSVRGAGEGSTNRIFTTL